MKKLIFTWCLFLTVLSLRGQINSLPTIDDPKDADRISTYTRGFAAVFRLDTLRSYFSNGNGNGNGIYTGSGTVTNGTTAQATGHPNGTMGDTELYFGKLLSGDYYTGIQSFDANGDGMRLQSRIDGATDLSLSPSLILSTLNNQSSFTDNTWYYNGASTFRGFDWSRIKPGLRVGPTDFVDMPDALPASDNSVWVVQSDGTGAWTAYASAIKNVRPVNLNRPNSLGTIADVAFTHEDLPVGLYTYKLMISFETDPGGGTMPIGIYPANTLQNFSLYSTHLPSLLGQQSTNYTVPTNADSPAKVVIMQGTFYNSTLNNDVEVRWGAGGTSDIEVLRGSFFEIEKID